MASIKNRQRATQGVTAVLLLGIAFVAGAAEQMLRALPAVHSNAVVAPAGLPPVAKPPSPNAPMLQNKLAPPAQGAGKGVALLSPDAACATNSLPRITSINRRQSGIEFKPGDTLNIVGCGFGNFGNGGHLYLVSEGIFVPLVIDGWADATIRAHIDIALGKVPDLAAAMLRIQPIGKPLISSSPVHSFQAVRDVVSIALPPNLGIYSNIYMDNAISSKGFNAISSPDGKSTIVERNFRYIHFCPAVTNQQTQLVDTWPIDSNFLKAGFEVVGTNYLNQTNQDNWDGDDYQNVLVGNNGGANYDTAQKRVTVTFQGHSLYAKKHIGFQGDTFGDNPPPGTSKCTSRYSVSLTVKGPRGVSPVR